jgi:hypothetical protein
LLERLDQQGVGAGGLVASLDRGPRDPPRLRTADASSAAPDRESELHGDVRCSRP